MANNKNIRLSPLGICLKRSFKNKIQLLIESPEDLTTTKITFRSETPSLENMAWFLKGYYAKRDYSFEFKLDWFRGSIIVGYVYDAEGNKLFNTSMIFLYAKTIRICEYYR